jgi:hypothetical protein
MRGGQVTSTTTLASSDSYTPSKKNLYVYGLFGTNGNITNIYSSDSTFTVNISGASGNQYISINISSPNVLQSFSVKTLTGTKWQTPALGRYASVIPLTAIGAPLQYTTSSGQLASTGYALRNGSSSGQVLPAEKYAPGNTTVNNTLVKQLTVGPVSGSFFGTVVGSTKVGVDGSTIPNSGANFVFTLTF